MQRHIVLDLVDIALQCRLGAAKARGLCHLARAWLIAADRGRRRDNKKFIIRKPCDGHVRLYVASLIKELRIDNFTDRHRHIIRRNALQHSFGVDIDGNTLPRELCWCVDLAHAGSVVRIERGEKLPNEAVPDERNEPTVDDRIQVGGGVADKS